MEFFRPGSLRFKALVAVILVVIAPAVWVWGTSLWDRASIALLRIDLDAATAKSVLLAERGTLDPEVIASSRDLRVRVLDLKGHVLEDADHEGVDRWYHPLTDPFFGPEGRPDPTLEDGRRASLATRQEVVLAVRDGRGTDCATNARGNLMICAQAHRVDTPGGTRIVHLQQSRAIASRSLYEDRFQIAQLTLNALLFAVLLTFWLGTRWVRPLESLRDQALARTVDGLSTEPLVSERKDEFGQVTAAFNTLLAAIEERNRSNERFAADLAHELKNPIAAVKTAAEALQPGKPLTEARAARLHRILDDSSARMAVVMDRFLELARAEAGLHDTQRTPLDLVDMVDGLLASMRSDERFANVRFEREGAEAVPARVAAERLETALRNLLANAATFASPDGTVTVRLTEEPSTIVLQVVDTGPGIAEDDLPRIFDRYFTRRQGGTGLGLALCRAIVEAHGGTLSAASPPGEGAVFTARLPRG